MKNISYNGKEVAFMDYFLAVNDKQLGICLRMLYASIPIEYDATAFIFTLIMGLPLFFAKENWIM